MKVGFFLTSQLSLGPQSIGETGLLLGATGLISSPISLSIFSVLMCYMTGGPLEGAISSQTEMFPVSLRLRIWT